MEAGHMWPNDQLYSPADLMNMQQILQSRAAAFHQLGGTDLPEATSAETRPGPGRGRGRKSRGRGNAKGDARANHGNSKLENPTKSHDHEMGVEFDNDMDDTWDAQPMNNDGVVHQMQSSPGDGQLPGGGASDEIPGGAKNRGKGKQRGGRGNPKSRARPNHLFEDRNVRLNAKICQVSDKGDIWELLDLPGFHLVEMNCVNLSTFLHRAARLAKRTNTVAAASRHPNLSSICAKVDSELAAQEVSMVHSGLGDQKDTLPRCWATLAWSYATLQVKAPHTCQRIARLSEKHMDSLKTFELANLLWAFAKMRMNVPGLFAEATRIVPKQVDEFSPVGLSTIAWACVTLQSHAPAALLKRLAAAFVRQIDKAGSQEIANMCWSLATAKVVQTPIFQALGQAALEKLHNFKLQELGNTAWAFSRAGVRHRELFQAFTQLFEKRPKLTFELHEQAIANLMWALTKQVACGSPLKEALPMARLLLPACCKALDRMKPQEFSSVLWSVGKLSFKQGDNQYADMLFEKGIALKEERLKTVSVQGLTNILYAYVEFVNDMSVPPYSMFLERLALQILNRMSEFESIGLVYIIQSMHVLLARGIPMPYMKELVHLMAMQFEKFFSDMTPATLARIAEAAMLLDRETRSTLGSMVFKCVGYIGETKFTQSELDIVNQVFFDDSHETMHGTQARAQAWEVPSSRNASAKLNPQPRPQQNQNFNSLGLNMPNLQPTPGRFHKRAMGLAQHNVQDADGVDMMASQPLHVGQTHPGNFQDQQPNMQHLVGDFLDAIRNLQRVNGSPAANARSSMQSPWPMQIPTAGMDVSRRPAMDGGLHEHASGLNPDVEYPGMDTSLVKARLTEALTSLAAAGFDTVNMGQQVPPRPENRAAQSSSTRQPWPAESPSPQTWPGAMDGFYGNVQAASSASASTSINEGTDNGRGSAYSPGVARGIVEGIVRNIPPSMAANMAGAGTPVMPNPGMHSATKLPKGKGLSAAMSAGMGGGMPLRNQRGLPPGLFDPQGARNWSWNKAQTDSNAMPTDDQADDRSVDGDSDYGVVNDRTLTQTAEFLGGSFIMPPNFNLAEQSVGHTPNYGGSERTDNMGEMGQDYARESNSSGDEGDYCRIQTAEFLGGYLDFPQPQGPGQQGVAPGFPASTRVPMKGLPMILSATPSMDLPEFHDDSSQLVEPSNRHALDVVNDAQELGRSTFGSSVVDSSEDTATSDTGAISASMSDIYDDMSRDGDFPQASYPSSSNRHLRLKRSPLGGSNDVGPKDGTVRQLKPARRLGAASRFKMKNAIDAGDEAKKSSGVADMLAHRTDHARGSSSKDGRVPASSQSSSGWQSDDGRLSFTSGVSESRRSWADELDAPGESGRDSFG